MARQLERQNKFVDTDDSMSEDDQKSLPKRKPSNKANHGIVSTEVTSLNRFEDDMNQRELVKLIQEQNIMISSDS